MKFIPLKQEQCGYCNFNQLISHCRSHSLSFRTHNCTKMYVFAVLCV